MRWGLSRNERFARWFLAVAGVVCLTSTLYFLRTETPEPYPWTAYSVSPFIVGPAWLVSGWIAWSRRPQSRIGLLLMLTGTIYLIGELIPARWSPIWTLAFMTGGLYVQVGAQALATFPSGRLRTRREKLVVGGIWVVGLLGTVGEGLLVDPHEQFPAVPVNLLAIHNAPALVDDIDRVLSAVGAVVVCGLLWLLADRWRSATAAGRRVLAPVYLGGAIAGVFALAREMAHVLDAIAPNWAWWKTGESITYTLVPIGFLVGLLRSTMGRSDVADLVVALGSSADATGHPIVQEELARRLGDPSLELVYLLDDGVWVDAEGAAMHMASLRGDPGRQVVEIDVDGTTIGALVHDSALAAEPEMVQGAVAAARLAIANDHLRASLMRQLDEVQASRRRIVEAGDHARRQVERDLHDGAQQRLVAMSLALRMLEQDVDDPRIAEDLESIRNELAVAVHELRALARGIHPAVLTDEGLAPAIESLADRANTIVRLGHLPSARFPDEIEITAYFVVAEALTNVAKHAPDAGVDVGVEVRQGRLVVEISDDGPGGAHTSRGTGLAGLEDRVAAVAGHLTIESPFGVGTRVVASIPIPEMAEGDQG